MQFSIMTPSRTSKNSMNLQQFRPSYMAFHNTEPFVYENSSFTAAECYYRRYEWHSWNIYRKREHVSYSFRFRARPRQIRAWSRSRRSRRLARRFVFLTCGIRNDHARIIVLSWHLYRKVLIPSDHSIFFFFKTNRFNSFY